MAEFLKRTHTGISGARRVSYRHTLPPLPLNFPTYWAGVYGRKLPPAPVRSRININKVPLLAFEKKVKAKFERLGREFWLRSRLIPRYLKNGAENIRFSSLKKAYSKASHSLFFATSKVRKGASNGAK